MSFFHHLQGRLATSRATAGHRRPGAPRRRRNPERNDGDVSIFSLHTFFPPPAFHKSSFCTLEFLNREYGIRLCGGGRWNRRLSAALATARLDQEALLGENQGKLIFRL